MRIEETTVLEAPPERVWKLLTEWERQASWMPDVAWIRLLGPERELGARLAVRTKVLGIPAVTDVVVVTGWEPARRLAVEHRGRVQGRGEWRLEPSANGDRTRFTWAEELSMPPRWVGELALRCYGPIQRALLRRSVRNLGRLARP